MTGNGLSLRLKCDSDFIGFASNHNKILKAYKKRKSALPTPGLPRLQTTTIPEDVAQRLDPQNVGQKIASQHVPHTTEKPVK